MKSWQLLMVVVAFSVWCVSAQVEAQSVVLSIDGESTNVPLTEVAKNSGTIFLIGEGEEGFLFETENGSLFIGGALNPDPFIQFGGAAVDVGGPSAFGISIISPVTLPFPGGSRVFDSFSGSVTNGLTDNSMIVTALAPPAGIPVDGDPAVEMQVFTLSNDGGLNWKNVGLDLGPTTDLSPLAHAASTSYGEYNEGTIPTIAGAPWTHMRADVNFSLTGGGDTFTFNGAKLLVPEPASIVLMGVAMLMLGASRRKFA